MKKKLTYLLILLSGLFSSCQDWLEIKPETEIVLDEYWQSSSQVEATVASCYRALLEDNCMRQMIVWGELRSDNMIKGANNDNDLSAILSANILPSNGYTSWKDFYQVINYCNIVLHYAPGVLNVDPNFTEGELNFYLSEVLTLRALCYFYLVRTFGSVPMVLDASIDDTQEYKLPQSSENEILTQIVSDLIKAKSYARDDYPTILKTKGHVTKNTIRALLADIYLWQDNYSGCIENCNEILSKVVDDDFIITNTTTRDYLKLIEEERSYFSKIFYVKNSTESIFELQYSETGKKNSIVPNFYGNSAGNDLVRGYADVNGVMYNIYPEKDVRRQDYLWLRGTAVATIFKYVGQSRGEVESSRVFAGSTCNWIVYRLTDIMLMKAEALVQQNGNDEKSLRTAISLVNKTYMRANYELNLSDSLSFDKYNTKDDMELLVLEERQRELAFEGKRWYDLMRYARRHGAKLMFEQFLDRKYQDRLIANKMSFMDALYFPINQGEMDKNPNLKQNDYYKK